MNASCKLVVYEEFVHGDKARTRSEFSGGITSPLGPGNLLYISPTASGMTPPLDASHEVHPSHLPMVPNSQNPFVPKGPLQRLVDLFPGGQFLRYLCVGAFNTVFGYLSFVVTLSLLNAVLPAHLLYLTVILASLLSSPVNITVAYFGYKYFVFRTKGNFLREWLKCFAVYGTGMIPGLVALSALARYLQSSIHAHATSLHVQLAAVEAHLSGRPLEFVHHYATAKGMAGYIAGGLVIGVSTVYSFVGHKKVTFRETPEQVRSEI